jgi:uncharacterized protein YjeT (DUF2065 family)
MVRLDVGELAMSHAGWMHVWNSAVAAIAAEPIWYQIAVALGVAFAAVMCLEGIRATFFPRRYAAMLTQKYAPDAALPRTAESSVDGSVQQNRAKHGSPPRRVVRNRKLELSSVNPHTPLRPRIQRIAMVKALSDAPPAAVDLPAAELFKV